jgi:hypothetical protein
MHHEGGKDEWCANEFNLQRRHWSVDCRESTKRFKARKEMCGKASTWAAGFPSTDIVRIWDIFVTDARRRPPFHRRRSTG